MYLDSISFSKKTSGGGRWSFENCSFNNINLISGKNASGKTRLLKAVNTLSILFLKGSTRTKSESGLNWKLNLKAGDKEFLYDFSYDKGIILKENLKIDGEEYLTRDEYGKGNILYEEIGEKIDFEVEKNKIVIASKRDKKQHPCLEKIFDWANSVFFYNFSSKLGRDTLMAIKQELESDENELAEMIRDDKGVVGKFKLGYERFGNEFKKRIISDFNKLGYSLKDVGVTEIPPELEKKIKGIPWPIPDLIYIVEEGVKGKIFQHDISQGMFRALSLIIQLTYLEFSFGSSYLVLIDDIGEGLDFERATKLIRFLIKKAEKLKDKLQLVMTTNDRFVMNNVSLKYWTIIDRINGKINFYSQKTHGKIFEDFQDIGLNNFDFFSGQYYKET